MIDFMILGLPRSGTTWAANLLTTDTTICLHDTLLTTHYTELDKIEKGGKRVGVACTGLYRFPEWVNAHPAKKVALFRPLEEVNKSLADIGLMGVGVDDLAELRKIKAAPFYWADLFVPSLCAMICESLGVPFDADRHAELVNIEMQPKFSGLKVGAEVTRRLVEEMQRALA